MCHLHQVVIRLQVLAFLQFELLFQYFFLKGVGKFLNLNIVKNSFNLLTVVIPILEKKEKIKSWLLQA